MCMYVLASGAKVSSARIILFSFVCDSLAPLCAALGARLRAGSHERL